MTARRALAAAGAAALALLLVWFLAQRGEDEAARRIERRARIDLLGACNQAALASGERVRFQPEDIAAGREELLGRDDGVATLVSAFEARRDGLVCKWNGIEPATISRDQ